MKNTKKPLYRFTVLSILVLSISSCWEDGKQKPDEDDTQPIVEAPKQVIIPIEEAKTAYETYGKRRLPLIQRYEDSINRNRYYGKTKQQHIQQNKNNDGDQANEAPAPFDVARYVYYDYKTIKQYMAYIEQEAKLAGVEISTLRFYFSNYPDETYFPKSKDSILHPRQNSLLISPTIKKGDGDFLFYIDDTNKEDPKAVILDSGFGRMKGIETGFVNPKNNRTYASFIPSPPNSKPNTTALLPYQNGKSLTSNRGNGAPPPYEQ